MTSVWGEYPYAYVVCEGGRSLIRPKQNNTAVQSVSIGNRTGTTSDNTTYSIVLPYGSTIPTNPEDITIVLDDKYAVIEDLKTEDGGKTWTFTVLADAGQTDVQKVYTINVSVESAPVDPVDPVTPEPPVYNPPVYQPDDSGEELNGWRVLSGGTVYYRHSVKVKNWQKIDGESYYFDRQGYLQYGWLQQDSDWYYLDAFTGAQQFGWVRVKNTWYYLDPETGKMYADGQYVIDRETYYFYDWGGMAAAWWYLDADTGLWYYFRGNGAMAKSAWIEWKGEYYYVGSSGAMLVNTATPDGYRVDGDGKWIR